MIEPAHGHQLFQALFEPRSVALIGASGDARKNTSRPQRYLRKHGYKGRIIPVNPGRDEIFGEKAYPDVASVPEPIDHAFVMVPADAVQAAIQRDRARRRRATGVADLDERYQSLTQRERDIMGLVVIGRLNKQIAAELGLAEVTVKAHRGQIMHKMGAKSLPELVRMADRLRGTPETD